jgi:hypothetical protein
MAKVPKPVTAPIRKAKTRARVVTLGVSSTLAPAPFLSHVGI